MAYSDDHVMAHRCRRAGTVHPIIFIYRGAPACTHLRTGFRARLAGEDSVVKHIPVTLDPNDGVVDLDHIDERPKTGRTELRGYRATCHKPVEITEDYNFPLAVPLRARLSFFRTVE